METTLISWTDHTFNPWMGCRRVSPGCTNCYAEPQNILRKRTGQLYHPADRSELQFKTTNERRQAFNFYWQRTLLPWITEHVSPLRIVATRMYRRGTAMLYWGVVIDGTDAEIRRHEKRKVC